MISIGIAQASSLGFVGETAVWRDRLDRFPARIPQADFAGDTP